MLHEVIICIHAERNAPIHKTVDAYIHPYIHTSLHPYMHACTHACIHAYMLPACINERMHSHMQIHAYTTLRYIAFRYITLPCLARRYVTVRQ